MENGAYMVMVYNEVDAEYGCDPGATVYMDNLTAATAKAIARHMNKASPDFVSYFVESEPMRWY